LAWHAALRGLYPVGRGRQPCMLSASLMLPCFAHFSRVYFAYSMVRKLFESARFGAKAFDGATAFNANIGSWNTASMTTMSTVCALCHRLRVRRGCLARLGARRCIACLPSAAADSPACFCRASLILLCFTHFSRVYFAYSVVRKLSESVWFGAKAFRGATVFNANIGSWNTASMATMSYVCALCHRLRVRRGCLGLGRSAALPVCRRPRPIEAAAMAACLCASLISRVIYVH
jgi:hypothetical protein